MSAAKKIKPVITDGEAVRLDGLFFPKGARFAYVQLPDMRLRVMLLPSRRKDPRGSVILVPGRTEFCEKYFETAEDFRTRGFTVFVMDHRGQGLSDRILDNVLGSYIKSFNSYVNDLVALLELFQAELPRPHIMVGHSMGGAIGLLGMLQGKLAPDAAVYNAPMLGLVGLEQPFVTPILQTMSAMGLAKRPIPFQAQRAGLPVPFANNKLTSDKGRYNVWRAYFDNAPRLRLGGPTYAWINASAKAIRFINRNAKNLKTPTLMVSAGSDRIVIPEDVESFAQRAGCELLRLPEARHETFLEQDYLRHQFFDRFDAFCEAQAL